MLSRTIWRIENNTLKPNKNQARSRNDLSKNRQYKLPTINIQIET